MVNGLAIDCERGGVEDLDGAVLDAFFDLGQLFSSAGGRDGLVQRSHDNFVVRHALAPVLLKFGAVDNALDGMDKVVRPVDAGADDGGLGRDGGHVVVIAGVVHAASLSSGRRGGVIGVLGDDDAAEVDQRLGGVRFRGGVRPGADELNLHGRARADAARAQIVSGEAGNDLREGVRADVADDSLILGDLAVVDELLHLQARGNTRDIAAFIDVGECVVRVGQIVIAAALVGHADELHVRILGRNGQHGRLVAVRVVEDDLAAILDQLFVGNGNGVALDEVPLDDPFDVDAFGLQLLVGSFLAAHEVVGVALVVLIADEDEADLDGLAFFGGIGGVSGIAGVVGVVGGFGRVGGGRGVVLGGVIRGLGRAGHQREYHHERQEQSDDLFHSFGSS